MTRPVSLCSAIALTVSTSAYAAGDCVGGKLSIPVRADRPLLLQSLNVVDLDNQKAALEVLFFDADPSAGTYTDNAAATIHATDTPKIIARVPVAAADYVTVGSRAIASVTPGGRVCVDVDTDGYLYALIVTSGTPTYSTTASLTLRPGFVRAE